MYPAMEDRDRKQVRREARALAAQRPLLPALPLPMRYFLGFGLLAVSLWLPSFVSLFHR